MNNQEKPKCPKGLIWEYNGDGRFRRHLGKIWKRYWNKYHRRQCKKKK